MADAQQTPDAQRLADLRRLAELKAVPVEPLPDEMTLNRANPNRGQGPVDAFRIAAGRGMTNLARGAGLVDQESPEVTSNFEQLQNAMPIATGAGEIAGEATPFLLPGSGISAVAGTGARVVASGLLGALEGALITRGRGGDLGETATVGGISGIAAGTMEALFPIASRLVGAVFRRARGFEPRGPLFTNEGIPTPELGTVLEETGITLDALSERAVDILEAAPQGANADQTARAARFSEAGIDPTRGNITQEFQDVADEERLASMASGSTGEPLRQRRLEQSESFVNGINSMVDELGIPDEVGANVKLALTGRLKDLTKQKNDLYKTIGETSPHVAEMPLFTDDIANALPSSAELRRASRLQGNNVEALQELMVEFGIEQSDEAIEAFTASGGEVIPLNVGNFEEFRQALNQLRGGISPGEKRTSFFVGGIIDALDGEVDIVDKALQGVNITDRSVVESIAQARNIVRGIKTEFTPADIVGKLVGKNRDGVTPLIEASKVAPTLMAPNAPIEKLQRTVQSLQRSGPAGQTALGDLQAATIMRALDDAVRAPSRKTSGVQTVAFSQFFNNLNKIGDEKLQILFANNPSALSSLNVFRETARDLTPTSDATPKGSAPVIMDLFNRMGQMPGFAAVRDMVNLVVKAGSDDRALRRAFNASPEIQRTASEFQQNFPALASTLGIAVFAGSEDEN